VGLNVNSFYTAPPSSGGTKPIYDELAGANYKKVIINLGLNEVGWPSQETFINRYTNIVNDIKTRLPGAKVYVVAMTPVTKKYSNSTGADNGINIKNINRTNGMIESMCASTGAIYVPNPSELFDAEGYLPAEASSDGVHMNLQYDRIWAAHIAGWVRSN
jgi:lysophospholipase L1-like esterase